MVWDPARVTPKSWAGVVEFYRNLQDRNDDFSPLGRLAERLASRASSVEAPPLFGATSGTSLLLARRADADWAHDALRIDVGLGGSIRFILPGKPGARECDGERIVETFEALLRDARWGQGAGA
jgi:hypothetical protein